MGTLRRALVVAAAVLLTSASVVRAETVRVVSFNLFHGGPTSGWFGDGHRLEERLDLVRAELRTLAPDVIGLQEASAAWGRGDIAARLAGALGLHHVFGPATTRVFGHEGLGRLVTTLINFTEGPAILSRYPIVARAVYELPRCARRLDPRVLVHAELRAPWGPLHAFSVHTSHDACQVRRVVELVRRHARGGPAVLMGDFNHGERSAVIAAVTGEAGFIDAFRASASATDGATVWQRPGAPAPTVTRRADYVFVLPGGGVSPSIRASRVVLNEPRRLTDGTTLWPSDHYGVLADLEVGP
jgi:endonuclease/exonuclease/phosphatase family metal-dependent hydrolase